MSADVSGLSLKISWKKVVFLVIQNYALLFLSWTSFRTIFSHSRSEQFWWQNTIFPETPCISVIQCRIISSKLCDMKRSYLTLWGQKHLFLPYTMASISKLWDLFFILDKKFIQLVNKSQFVIVTFLKCFFFVWFESDSC